MSQPPTPWRQLRTVADTLERIAGELTLTDLAQVDPLKAHAAGLRRVAAALIPVDRPDALTPQQSRVLEYIRKHIAQHGEAPTRKEMMAEFSFASPNAAQEHLAVLERKGWLTVIAGATRGIRINERTPTPT